LNIHPVLYKYRLFFLSFALICVTFPDIILAPGSLMVADHQHFDGTPAPFSLYSSITMRFKHFADMGGSLWQSEPKISYMKHLMQQGESPYWNPYQGAGSLGPESMIDIKFSPLTLLSALLGASSLAGSFVILFFLGLGNYCLIRLCYRLLELPLIAGVAAAMAYMFNGFQIFGLAVNYAQSYLLFPIYLYALFAFVKYGGLTRFIGAYIAGALVLAPTFIPTTVLVFVTATLLAAGYALEQHLPFKRGLMKIILIGAAPVCTLLLVAFIYLPIIQVYSFSHDAKTYADRFFYPATINALLSVFTPQHLSYRGNNDIMGSPDYPIFMGNFVFHIGIVAGLLALLGLRKSTPKGLLLFTWGMTFLLLMRIFGIPGYDYSISPAYKANACLRIVILTVLLALPVYRYALWKRPYWLVLLLAATGLFIGLCGIDFYDKAINALPVVGKFGEQYTWVAVMVCLPVLVAYGMAALFEGMSVFKPARIYLACMLGFFLYLAVMLPFKDWHWRVVTYMPGFLISLYIMYRICALERNAKYRIHMPLLLLGLLYTEYWYYMDHLHPLRMDAYNHPPAYVRFIKEHIGRQRILNIGPNGFPGEQAGAFQIQDVAIMTMNVPPDYQDFFLQDFLPKEYNYNNFLSFMSAKDDGILDLNLTGFLGIKYILAPSDWEGWHSMLAAHDFTLAFHNEQINVYENPTPWPRAFIAPANAALTVEALKKGDIALHDLLPAHISQYRNTHIAIDVDTPRPGMLVLTDSWYPYWFAHVNGQAVPVEKVFRAFRGVTVPKGHSEVEFYYDNPAVNWGIRISVAMGLLTLCGLGWGVGRKIKITLF